jgi:hypothetical protein
MKLLLALAAGIVKLLRDLDRQAKKEGGAVYMLNGNHESLNVCGDFRSELPQGPSSTQQQEAAAAPVSCTRHHHWGVNQTSSHQLSMANSDCSVWPSQQQLVC